MGWIDSLKKEWSTLVTILCIVAAAIVLAWQEAASNVPADIRIPRLGGAWHYLPVTLLTASGISWLVGRYRKSTQVIRLSGTNSSAASALASLPVYRHDLEIELLAVCVGTTLGFPATVFLLVKPWAKKDLNIVRVSVRIFTNFKGTYEGIVLRDLSEWLLREEFNDPKYNSMNSRKTSLESAQLSLIKEIESGIFQEGHHTAKWLGCRVDERLLDEKDIRKVTIRFHDKDGIAKSEVFEKWPETSLRVNNIEFEVR